MTSLMHASGEGRTDIVKVLLTIPGIHNINKKNKVRKYYCNAMLIIVSVLVVVVVYRMM